MKAAETLVPGCQRADECRSKKVRALVNAVRQLFAETVGALMKVHAFVVKVVDDRFTASGKLERPGGLWFLPTGGGSRTCSDCRLCSGVRPQLSRLPPRKVVGR